MMNDPVIERFVKPLAILSQNAVDYCNACALQNRERLPAMSRVRIGRAHNHLFYPGGDDRFRAWRRASMSAARFEGDVERCAFHALPASLCILERFNLRMRFASAFVPAFPDHPAVFDQHGADHWI